MDEIVRRIREKYGLDTAKVRGLDNEDLDRIVHDILGFVPQCPQIGPEGQGQGAWAKWSMRPAKVIRAEDANEVGCWSLDYLV